MKLGRLFAFAGITFVIGRLIYRLYQDREALALADGPLEVGRVIAPALREAAHGV